MLAIYATSMPIGGIRYLAVGGNYFYQTDDGALAIASNPEMTVRTYMGAEERNNVRSEVTAGKR
ncbi:hypothetical protein [Burkholderia lata]|uniref:hypothetical protein n=1 Tax=Burkholderia lata (strain ATCC 17760 / DSM 23089 / LMG 22485 / NCIMB 9086 / R18194 / 383) TaxID=482957 RepID=UPI00399AB74A